MKCSVEVCDGPAERRGWCQAHYMRWRKNGDPGTTPIRRIIGAPTVCTVEGCYDGIKAQGLCVMHYNRWQRHGDPLNSAWTRERRPKDKRTCSVDGCDKPVTARGWCQMHWSRWRKTGAPGEAESRSKNGQGGYNAGGYRVLRVGLRRLLEHRWVMEQMLGRPVLAEETVHHINGNKADNRPENLELWSTSQPKGQRVEDKVAWARQILALYGDDFVQPRLNLENGGRTPAP